MFIVGGATRSETILGIVTAPTIRRLQGLMIAIAIGVGIEAATAEDGKGHRRMAIPES
jgi:hypothetical protein